MTTSEMVNETVDFYLQHPEERAYNDLMGTCLYKTEDGRKCAVGRMLDEEKLALHQLSTQRLDEWGDINEVCYNLEDLGLSLNDILKEEYQDAQVEVLNDLQNFHDASDKDKRKERGEILKTRYE